MEKLFDAEQIKLTNQIIALMGLVCLANLVDWLIITIRFQSIFECYKEDKNRRYNDLPKCVGLVADINYCNNICKLDSTTVNGFGFLSFGLFMVGASFGHNFGSRNEEELRIPCCYELVLCQWN